MALTRTEALARCRVAIAQMREALLDPCKIFSAVWRFECVDRLEEVFKATAPEQLAPDPELERLVYAGETALAYFEQAGDPGCDEAELLRGALGTPTRWAPTGPEGGKAA